MLNLFLTEYAVDKVAPILKWVTVGLASLFILGLAFTWVLSFLKEKTKLFSKTAKYGFLSLVLYLAVVGILMLVLEIVKHYDTAYLEDNWVSKDIVSLVFLPLLITLCVFVVVSITAFIVSRKKPNYSKITGVIGGLISLACVIVTVILIAVYYSNNISGDGYYTDESSKFNAPALYLCALGLCVLAIITALIVDRKGNLTFDAHSIALAGICVSLSFGLSFIKLWEMPYGGSVTLVSMLPIMIYSYTYGMKKGLLVGLVYGLLQAIQDPFIVHPAQFLLDYPIAFAMTGFAGILKELKALDNLPQLKFGLCALVGGSFRAIAHIFAGVFAFGAYAVDSGASNFWVYSTLYNLYVLVDVALVVIVGAVLLSSKGFRTELNRFNGQLLPSDNEISK